MRLTATPNCKSLSETRNGVRYQLAYIEHPAAMTVWVEPDQLWLRPLHPISNNDAAHPEGWARMTEAEWRNLRDTVDRYFDSDALRKERNDGE